MFCKSVNHGKKRGQFVMNLQTDWQIDLIGHLFILNLQTEFTADRQIDLIGYLFNLRIINFT